MYIFNIIYYIILHGRPGQGPIYFMDFPGGSVVKNPPAKAGTRVPSLSEEDPLEKEMATPVFLPGKSHGHRSLAGYCSWEITKQSDMT